MGICGGGINVAVRISEAGECGGGHSAMWVAGRWRADKTGKKVARAEERLEETRTKTRKTTGYFPTGPGVSRVQAAEDRATDSSINMALGVEGRFSGRPGRVRNCILTSLVGRTRAPHYDPFGAALEKLQGMYYMAIHGHMRMHA